MAGLLSPQASAGTVQDMFDFSSPTPPVPDVQPVVGGDRDALSGNVLGGAFANLLSSFGVATVPERDEVEVAVEEELSRRGHEARMVKLRFETLYLETGPQQARLLRYDQEAIVTALDAKLPGRVERIVVRVAR